MKLILTTLNTSVLLIFLLLVNSVTAQTYGGAGGELSDNGQWHSFSINVSGLPVSQIDTIYGLSQVKINVQHENASQLIMKLEAPDGNEILLFQDLCWGCTNFINTAFRDDATEGIIVQSAPFTGSYRPIENLGYLNNKQTGSGQWTLWIKDTDPWSSSGSLLGWELQFDNNPGRPIAFKSTNLPIVMINTNGHEIIDDPKIMADFIIIDNGLGASNHPDDSPSFVGKIGIELRGSSSQTFPKKSYGLETWDDTGNSIDTSLLGMPAESDWILNANYADKTLMHNAISYQLWMNMGHYATRYRWVEVMLNGRYKGLYLFSEKIKRDKNRLNISKLEPSSTSGDKLTGGYIFKVDKSTGSGGDGWTSSFPPPAATGGQTIFFQYEYPKQDDIVQEQKSYISTYVNEWEAALDGPNSADTLIGWRKYAKEYTFTDYLLVNEVSKNVDGYRLSTFLHKDRDSKDGRISMGPVWDYDIAYGNADYCDGNLYSGWAYQFPCSDDYWLVPFWWEKLMSQSLFTDRLQCQWRMFRSSFLSNQEMNSMIDSLATMLAPAAHRNFHTWPTLGHYTWPDPYPWPTTWEEELNSFKSWLNHRLNWLDQNIPGTCLTVGEQEINSPSHLFINPNPASGYFKIEGLNTGVNAEVTVIDMTGRVVVYEPACTGFVYTTTLNSGLYLIRIQQAEEMTVLKLMIE